MAAVLLSGAPIGVAEDADLAALNKRLLPGIKGSENRRIIDSSDYPWSAVSWANTHIGGFLYRCSGRARSSRRPIVSGTNGP